MASPTTSTRGEPRFCTRSTSSLDIPTSIHLQSKVVGTLRVPSAFNGTRSVPKTISRRGRRLHVHALRQLTRHREMQQRQHDLVMPDQLDPLGARAFEHVDARAILRLLVEI